MIELHQFDVPALADGLRRGDFSAIELLNHCLARITRLDPALNAFVHLDPAARDGAAEADRRLRSGRPLGPLEGIPVAVKDNLLVRGMPAAWGSPLYAGRVAERDEAPVVRLRRAGAVILGKTNTPEFAMRGITDNPVFGASRNPWDLALTPGGSSGGSAAAVAAGLVPLSMATDGGGSIRRPAAHTGLVGLKPSLGRIPRRGGFPPLMADCEVVGALARTVSGARAMFEALATDVSPAPPIAAPRVLFVDRFGDAPVDPGVLARAQEAADRLADLGCRVEAGPLPFLIDDALAAWSSTAAAGLARLAAAEPRFYELAAPEFAEQARLGERMTAAEHAAVLERLQDFRVLVAEAFEAVDVILTPTVAAQPWPAREPYPAVIDGKPVGPRGHAVYTAWVNASGCPAIALPTAPHSDGLPTGVQLVGAWGADEGLLDLGRLYETAAPWAGLWPAMAG